MARDRLHQFAGRLVSAAPAWSFARSFFAQRIVIIFYHGVWPADDERLSLFGGITVSRLDEDLAHLSRRFRFIRLEDALEGRDVLDGEALVLTFDDGFDSTDDRVLEILERRKAPATAFVNTRSVDYDCLMWQHQLSAIHAERGEARFCKEINALQEDIGAPGRIQAFDEQIEVTRRWPHARKDELAYELWRRCDMPPIEDFLEERRPYMDWEGLARWMEAGHAVGCHTHSHPFCSGLTDADLGPELLMPGQRLGERLGIRSVPFAYPFGDRLPNVLERQVFGADVFSCMLGTAGLSRRGTPMHELERVAAEPGLDAELFSRPLVRHLRRR